MRPSVPERARAMPEHLPEHCPSNARAPVGARACPSVPERRPNGRWPRVFSDLRKNMCFICLCLMFMFFHCFFMFLYNVNCFPCFCSFLIDFHWFALMFFKTCKKQRIRSKSSKICVAAAPRDMGRAWRAIWGIERSKIPKYEIPKYKINP